MTAFAAMLRAVNVGGTGKLPMTQLKAIGEACGFTKVRTFIASGNLLFESDLAQPEVRARIEREVEAFFGKAVPVFIRSAAELAAVVAADPFASEARSRVVAHFMNAAPTRAMIDAATGCDGEQIALGRREIYIFYGEGMGQSKLKLPAFREGTARNMNSVSKMAGLLA